MAEDQAAEIKSRSDIVDLVSSYVSLNKAGKNYKGLCPFHSEKTPSFMVSPELQIFKCFGCNRGGDVLTFVQEVEGIGFPEALQILAEKAGVRLETYRSSSDDGKKKEILEINRLAKEYFAYLLNEHRVGEEARHYLKKRGILPETIKTFELGYAPDSWESLAKFLLAKKLPVSRLAGSGLIRLRPKDNSPYDFFRGRIMFPFIGHGGSVIGFSGRTLTGGEPKYLNIAETPLFKKGAFLYGLSQAKSEIKRVGEAIVAEGPFDVLSPHQAGTKNIVGSQGTALTPDQIKLLRRYTADISLCFDADFAGDAAARRAIGLSQQRGLNVKIITLPAGFNDADELAQKDPAAWKEAAAGAMSVYDFYFSSAFRRSDASSSLGKKRVAGELLPIIKSIADPIEREHFAQKLAASLSVGLDVIKSALESSVPAEGLSPKGQSLDKGDGKTGLSAENYLLALLLRSPLEAAQKSLHRLARHDFAGEEARAIFAALKEYLTGRKRPLDIEVFGAKIGEAQKALLGELYLLDLESVLSSEPVLESELQKSLVSVKKASLQRRLGLWSRKIKEAELTGDGGALSSARSEFKRLADQI